MRLWGILSMGAIIALAVLCPVPIYFQCLVFISLWGFMGCCVTLCSGDGWRLIIAWLPALWIESVGDWATR